jgi:FkbM family methyltransferase
MDSVDARFGPEKPFGSFAPGPLQASLIALGQRMPDGWAGRRGASFIRSLLKRISDVPVDAVRLGSRMRLYPRGNASEKRLMVSPQFFDPRELDLLQRFLTPDFVFIDIGANAGAYTLFVASRTGSGARIIAVEPHPGARERLTCNLALNGLQWVSVAPVALGDAPGEIDLHINERNMGSTSANAQWEPDMPRRVISVRCETLLDLVRSHGLERIDAIKADVEGLEDRILLPFLEAAPPALRPRLLIVEDGRRAWQRDLPGELMSLGYRAVLSTGGNLAFERTAQGHVA